MWYEQLKSGKYAFREIYVDPLTGKRKKVSVTLDKNTAQSRKSAQKRLDDIITDKLSCSQTMTDFGRCTLSELIEMYLADNKQSVKESTYRRNYYSMHSIARILGPDTLINRLTAQYVRTKYNELDNSIGYKNQSLKYFRMLIRWGYRNDIIQDMSYLVKLDNYKDVPHKEKIADKYLEKEELSALLDGMHVYTWKLLTSFLSLSGLRCGEAIALDRSDIDFDQKAIHITKTYDPNNKIVTSVKTHCSIRDVYMQPELEKICREINAHMLRVRLRSGKRSTLFITDESGNFINYYSYNKYLGENAAKILGRSITTHAIRHTHASILLAQGVSIDTISRRLGHEDSRVTKEIYLHITKELQRRDNDQLDKISII